MGGDPVPQALVITGIVVAFSATALAVALLLRLHEASGSATLVPPESQVRRRIMNTLPTVIPEATTAGACCLS